jgi:rare lipoprotein A
MKYLRLFRLSLIAAALAVGACSVTARRESPQGTMPGSGTSPVAPANVPPPPADPFSIPDAVPKMEPRARSGNPPFYEVFGKRYYVMASSSSYVERGVASWYGPGFHAERTSIGEPYDMYGMTAAHKTLSLPTYVRVTNLQNNRSVVVRVNDRGPFVGNRIIDLSYTAAAKLDMLRHGTAFVEVRAIDPSANPIGAITPVTSALLTPAPAPSSDAHGGLYIQAGAFADRTNAERLASRLRRGNYGKVFVRDVSSAGRTFYRVRIGPVADVAAYDRTVKAIEGAGVTDAHLALE